MNNEERTRILNMVAAGQVSPAEASDLLSALEAPPRPAPPPPVAPAPVQPPPPPRPAPGRCLVIRITDGGDSKVNVRIPLSLARAAGRFLPRQAKAYLNNFEIDLDQLLDEVSGEIANGPLIEVQDDDEHVLIGVE